MTVVKNSVSEKKTDLEDVLVKFSLCGRYHVSCMALIAFAYMTNSLYSSNYIFVAEEVRYWCKDEGFANNSCYNSENVTQVCSEWVYDNPDSFVAEFELACQDWKRTLVGTVHSAAYMIGLLLVGPLSDRIGRKAMVVMTGVLGGVFGVARSFVTNYWLYLVLEFLESAVGDVCSPMFMMAIEMVANDKRTKYQLLSTYGYTLGALSFPLLAYLFPYWRTLLRVMYTPAVLFVFYIFFLDESPRWLLSKGKKEEAIAILEKIAKKNKVKLDKHLLENLSYEEDKGVGFATLLKNTISSRTLLTRFFICLTWWTTSTFTGYGMFINSVSLQGNKYVNYALLSVMDIPGVLIILYVLTKYKKKIPLILSFFAAGILCTSQPFVSRDLPWLSVLMYMSGKMMASFYFSIVYLLTSELFPTYTRNSMHALCSSIGRIGSIIAPQTPLLMHYWVGLPSIVFGLASLLGGLVTFFVPDTADDSLPDTVLQAEAIGVKPKDVKTNVPMFVIPCRKEASRL